MTARPSRSARLAPAVVAALLILSVAASSQAAAAPPDGSRVVFRLHDPRIDEASGIGVGIRSPGVVYVQNDSGDVARFFALGRRTGATVATLTVPGATNVDWEDLAVARDPAGTPSVWLADIGDNDAVRRSVTVYRVPEPRLSASTRGATLTTSRPVVYRLRYPDGAQNAESLAVAPGGQAYVVTKAVFGDSGIYAVPDRPGRATAVLRRVGVIRFDAHGRSGPLGGFGQVLATGAAISPDGRLLVVRTYTGADVWRLAGGDVAAAIRTRPVTLRLPPQQQGEGVTFDGRALLVDSEGVGSAVWRVPLPASLARSPAPSSPRSRAGRPAAAVPPSPRDDGLPSAAVIGGGAVLVALVVAVGWAVGRRRAG